jgi:putative addiction module killer protein
MVTVIQSSLFKTWLDELKDERARARIVARLLRLEKGNPGDVKPVGEGISEMRIDYGPGCRVYIWKQALVTVIVLCGGDKRTQARDIAKAKLIVKAYSQEASHHGTRKKS